MVVVWADRIHSASAADNQGDNDGASKCRNTPATGFEPVTYRLTAGCSAVELRRNAVRDTTAQTALCQCGRSVLSHCRDRCAASFTALKQTGADPPLLATSAGPWRCQSSPGSSESSRSRTGRRFAKYGTDAEPEAAPPSVRTARTRPAILVALRSPRFSSAHHRQCTRFMRRRPAIRAGAMLE